MNKGQIVRDVFRDPDIGDVIEVDGERFEVVRVGYHPGKTVVRVLIDGRRPRDITLESWREYAEDAAVVFNTSTNHVRQA